MFHNSFTLSTHNSFNLIVGFGRWGTARLQFHNEGVDRMSGNLIHCLLWSGGVSVILVLEWIITSKLLQIWDKAHPVDKRGGSDGKKSN